MYLDVRQIHYVKYYFESKLFLKGHPGQHWSKMSEIISNNKKLENSSET